MKFSGGRLKALRQGKHMTQESIAEKLGVTRQTISNWEEGTNCPSLEKIGELAAIFEVDFTFFVEKTNG